MQRLSKQTLKIYWQHATRYKAQMFSLAVGILAATAIDVGRPFLYRDLFNTVSNAGPGALDTAFRIVWYIFLVGLLHQAVWRSMLVINSFFQPRIMSDLMNTCYEYLNGHSYNFFNNNFVGSIVTRVRRYQKSFEDIADQVQWNLGRTLLRITIILIVLFYYFWIIAVAILVWCILYLTFSYLFARYMLKYNLERSNQDTKTTAHLADTITNSINLKLFTSQFTEMQAFRKITDRLFQLRQFTWNLANYAEIVQGTLMVLLEFVIMYLAVYYWQRGQLNIGDFALLQSYLIQMFDHLWEVGRYIRNIYEALADANEMTEMLVEPHAITDDPHAGVLAIKSGAIEFKHVDFHYHKETPILENFNLSIDPGERIALIGPSGGGKSTIVKLLFRFMDIQGGQILIDGQNIAKVTQNSLRKQISLVPQEPILFHRTLLENIRYGRPEATEEEVIAAAKAAHCHEFISKFPEQYQTFVGERGVKLSGGERQRVAIARAILKNAPILVLDEATSSLDSESEHLIQDALHTLMKGKTNIVIAHRLSTIMEMDRIVVIENGRITEQGKHEELLRAQQGTYQKLWQIQAGGFATS